MDLDYANATHSVFEDRLLEELRGNSDVIIYGAGLSGQYVCKMLDDNGIKVACFVDGSERKQGLTIYERPVYSLEKAVSVFSDFAIVIASMWYEEIRDKILETYPDRKAMIWNGLSTMNWETVNGQTRSEEIEYINEHEKEFERLLNELADEESRKTLEGILNYRLTRKMEYLEKIRSKKRAYIDDSIISARFKKMINDRSIIDAGAFDGDSLVEFLQVFEGCRSYYCYEADKSNVEILKNREHKPDVSIRVIQKALIDKSGLELKFSGSGLSGRIGDDGYVVETTTIDDSEILSLGFVKMDIEGAERDALEGGRRTIAQNKPILAVCAYHLQDDLLVLPRVIKSIYSGYNLYLRHYLLSSGETVLYAIP
ncbi:MAG: FkbM family methyltransferase [Lachnospiraceae bacterium]|nr:FkbM family methyltransferase [Lachnospiraceae bacterium]